MEWKWIRENEFDHVPAVSLGRTTCPRHPQNTIAVMSLASDTRREAMLCSAVLVLPWNAAQSSWYKTWIWTEASESISLSWCLLPVNLPFPTLKRPAGTPCWRQGFPWSCAYQGDIWELPTTESNQWIQWHLSPRIWPVSCITSVAIAKPLLQADLNISEALKS